MKAPLLYLLLMALPTAAFCGPLDEMAAELGTGLKGKPPMRIAVLEFAYADNQPSGGPAVIQERLTTAMARRKAGTLVERRLLQRVMGELRLQASGIMDDKTIKKLGEVLAADAVVIGTLNDVPPHHTEVNARLVDAETAELLSAASAVVARTWPDTPPVAITPEEAGQTEEYPDNPYYTVPPEVKSLIASKRFMDARLTEIRKKTRMNSSGQLTMDGQVFSTPESFNNTMMKNMCRDLKAAGLEIPPALKSYEEQE